MKREGHLIESIANIDNLMMAYYQARRGKQHRYSVKEYGHNIFRNLLNLQEEILSGEITIGKYHYFKIYDPKERQICAAPFEERVLHHAIINVCRPYFERNLIYDTYATRNNKGVYAAIDRAKVAMKRYEYVAKLDVRKYFDSISHSILKQKLRKIFKDERLLNIFDKIIDSYCVEVDKGIPIGNLTSQYFANYYFSSIDHYMKEVLRVPVYVRYMDDILLFSEDFEAIKRYVNVIDDRLQQTLLLQFKPPVIRRTCYGVSFLGYKLCKHAMFLNRRSKIRFRRKMLQYESYRNSGFWSEDEYMQHITPLLAFAKKADTWNLRQSICCKNDAVVR